ncbi:hypothetical protein ACWEOE_07490 [Amycolatopsis sp. NPDC004368]
MAYSLAVAVFGGLTPLASTLLIDLTKNKMAPGYLLIGASVLAGLALVLLRLRHRDGHHQRTEQPADQGKAGAEPLATTTD